MKIRILIRKKGEEWLAKNETAKHWCYLCFNPKSFNIEQDSIIIAKKLSLKDFLDPVTDIYEIDDDGKIYFGYGVDNYRRRFNLYRESKRDAFYDVERKTPVFVVEEIVKMNKEGKK